MCLDGAPPICVVSLAPSKERASERISNDWRAIDPHSINGCVSLQLTRVPTLALYELLSPSSITHGALGLETAGDSELMLSWLCLDRVDMATL